MAALRWNIGESWRRQSLRWRLPILICGLFLVVLIVVLYAAYREVDATLHQAAADRAQHAADQVAAMLGRSSQQTFDLMQRVGPSLREYLREPTEAHLLTARAALKPLAPGPNRRIVVWDADEHRLFELPDGADTAVTGEAVLPRPTRPPKPGIGPLRAEVDRVFTDAGVVVHDAAVTPPSALGMISIRGGLTLSPPDALSRLVGADARILFGNRDGDVWSDLARIVSGPAIDLRLDGSQSYRSESGEERVGALRGLAGTPWVIWVEFPRAVVTSRAGTFLRRMAILGLLVAAGTVFMLRWFTVRVTAPLGAMTTAAEAMAGGDYSRRVGSDRADEIGRLGRAFNRMASQVESDIARRIAAEASLRASEGRYRTLFDYAPDGALIADAEARYLDANPGICRMLGYSRDELVGLRASDILAPKETTRVAPAFPTVAADSASQRVWYFRRRDGSVFPADVIATRMPDGRMLEMVRDITEQNKAIDALRAAEERMRFALQSADVGIWDVDYRTGVFRGSEILEAQYGVERGGLGDTVDAFLTHVHPDDRATVRATVDRAMKSGADFSLQHRVVRPDGTLRWLTGAGRIHLGDHGEPLRGVGISLDVTERHALEAQYQQAQKMDAIGRLAGGVAHDFNNLLTAMLGYCELILESRDLNDAARGDITEVQKAATSAAALTRQLLTFSRKQIIQPTLLDLNVVVSEMRAMLARLIRSDVAIVLQLWPEVAPVVADRGQVEQIILNLAVNARDAMRRGGVLTIETALVELDEQYAAARVSVNPGAYVVLQVSDTGVGMTADVQAHLFEPFFTTKDVGEGTGLGLATVHGIVARSGGSIDISSEVGKGTSIKVYLPRAAIADTVIEPPAPHARPAPVARTVLIVDAADSVGRLARRLLQKEGYRVLLAANASEALELFAQHPSIDLLLTDVVMPGAYGPELTKELVERHPSLKVIYMSGYTEEAVVSEAALHSGAFLHKPFTADALARKIREVLEPRN